MWVVDGYCKEEILKPLGLYSHGGGSRSGQMTYNVWSKKYGKVTELTEDEINNIFEQEEIKVYLRKRKINNVLCSTRRYVQGGKL